MLIGKGKLIDGTGKVIHEGVFERGVYMSGQSFDEEGRPLNDLREAKQKQHNDMMSELRQGMAEIGARQVSQKEVMRMRAEGGENKEGAGVSDVIKNRKPLK